MTARCEIADSFMETFRTFDETEKLIIMGGIKALRDGILDVPKFEEWTGDLVRRYRAGEKLTVNDLIIPGQARA